MRSIERYSLVLPTGTGRRAVLEERDGAGRLEVDGTLLEAQFELGDGSRLIWLTDDSPYDEGLHVYLLGPGNVVEDALEAGADFAAGILKFRRIGSRSVEFQFFLNTSLYRLEVAQAALRIRLPK